jgi:hypothetical protein
MKKLFVFAMVLVGSLCIGFSSMAPADEPAVTFPTVKLLLCVGEKWEHQFQTSGGGLQQWEKPTASSSSPSVAAASVDSSDKLTISADAPGTTTVDVQGLFPTGLNGIGPAARRVALRYEVTVRQCEFDRGDWPYTPPEDGKPTPTPAPPKQGEPPPCTRPPTAPVEFPKGDEPCREDAIAAAKYAIARLPVDPQKGTKVSKTMPPTYAIVKAELDKINGGPGQKGTNVVYTTYTVKPNELESVTVTAVEGQTPGIGFQLIVTLYGKGICKKPERWGPTFFKTFFATITSRMDESTVNGHKFYRAKPKSTKTTLRVLCCPLNEEPGTTGGPGTPASPGTTPIDEDPGFKSVIPQPGDGTGTDQGVFLAPLAGPGSVMTGTVLAPDEPAGPKAFYVAMVDDQGHQKVVQGKTDPRGHLRFLLPAIAESIVTVELFRKFTKTGTPDEGSICKISNPPGHLPETEPLVKVPSSGPSISEASSSYESGGQGQSLIQLRTSGINPDNAKVLLDGSEHDVDTLATSNASMVGKMHPDVALGGHNVAVESDGARSNSFGTVVVTQMFDPLPPMKTGNVAPIRLHIGGLRPTDAAVVIFNVSGSATLARGGSSATVPVRDGLASVDIRATQPGELHITTRLEVKSPDFLSSS